MSQLPRACPALPLDHGTGVAGSKTPQWFDQSVILRRDYLKSLRYYRRVGSRSLFPLRWLCHWEKSRKPEALAVALADEQLAS